MEIVIGLAWLAGTIGTWRHLGYHFNEKHLLGHMDQNTCTTCICTRCGEPAKNHSYYDTRCRKGAASGMHFTPLALALPVSAALWVPLAAWFFTSAAAKKFGVHATFFKPTPEVLTKAEKDARRRESDAARIEELEAEYDRLSAEVAKNTKKFSY